MTRVIFGLNRIYRQSERFPPYVQNGVDVLKHIIVFSRARSLDSAVLPCLINAAFKFHSRGGVTLFGVAYIYLVSVDETAIHYEIAAVEIIRVERVNGILARKILVYRVTVAVYVRFVRRNIGNIFVIGVFHFGVAVKSVRVGKINHYFFCCDLERKRVGIRLIVSRGGNIQRNKIFARKYKFLHVVVCENVVMRSIGTIGNEPVYVKE